MGRFLDSAGTGPSDSKFFNAWLVCLGVKDLGLSEPSEDDSWEEFSAFFYWAESFWSRYEGLGGSFLHPSDSFFGVN